MTDLPKSIQAYLESAGFTSAQIGIIKNLIDGNEKTVRELAQMTKKGNGTIDDACKKMTSDGLLREHRINNTTKYSIVSIEVIKDWTERDVNARQQAILRQQQDFTTYIQSLENQEARPMMHHFEGVKGMQEAYKKLIDTGKEMLCFLPVQYKKEEEDPLYEIRKEIRCEREKRKIRARFIVNDTLLGRRFKDRDAFEYRETRVIPEKYCPIPYEKITAGHLTLIINHRTQSACLLEFNHMADTETRLFEVFWSGLIGGTDTADESEPVFFEKCHSALQEFFWSRATLLNLLVVGALSALLIYALYQNNLRIQKERFADKALAIAATIAPEVNGDLLEGLRKRSDIESDEYQEIFAQLNEIRGRNDGVAYIYILRPHIDSEKYEWIVDADSNYNLPFLSDHNQDGILNEADEAVFPGQKYNVSGIPELLDVDLSNPIKTKKFNSDQWGTFMTGYAPIFNSEKEMTGLLGVDYWADDVKNIALQEFKPLQRFLIFFVVLFLVYGFLYFWLRHRSLCEELSRLALTKRGFKIIGGCAALSLLVTLGMYWYTKELMKAEIGHRLMAIVSTAAPEIRASDLRNLRNSRDMRSNEYQRVYTKLNEIREQNEDILYAYIYRTSSQEGMLEFVADADSNYFLPHPNSEDPIEVLPPGTQYDKNQFTEKYNESLFERPVVNEKIVHDKWGSYVSAAAPIRDIEDKAVAALGVDMDVSDFYEKLYERFSPLQWFFGIFVGLLLLSMLMMCMLLHPPAIHD